MIKLFGLKPSREDVVLTHASLLCKEHQPMKRTCIQERCTCKCPHPQLPLPCLYFCNKYANPLQTGHARLVFANGEGRRGCALPNPFSMYFPAYLGSLQTERRFCSDKAFPLLLIRLYCKPPKLHLVRLLNMAKYSRCPGCRSVNI